MSSDKEKKPRKAPAKKAATTGEGAEKKVKAAAKPKAVAAEAKATPKAKTAAKSAVAAGVPEVAAQIAKPRPTHQQIAELAYSYYIERGWVDGHPEQDWFRAELVLLGR
jgi:hypothetical protein